MTKSNFNVGDRIVITNPLGDDPLTIGMRGTIVCINYDGDVFGVDFDEPNYGYFHNCNTCARKAHGWFVINDQISHIDDTACNIDVSAADLSKLF